MVLAGHILHVPIGIAADGPAADGANQGLPVLDATYGDAYLRIVELSQQEINQAGEVRADAVDAA